MNYIETCLSFIILKLFSFNLGKSWQDKVQEIKQAMSIVSVDALIITALDNVACTACIHLQNLG